MTDAQSALANMRKAVQGVIEPAIFLMTTHEANIILAHVDAQEAEIERLRGLLCKCNMRTRLVGDGCEFCNPQLADELAKVFYDANLNYEQGRASEWAKRQAPFRWAGEEQGKPENDDWLLRLDYLGDWAVICSDCAKTHKTAVVPIERAPDEPKREPLDDDEISRLAWQQNVWTDGMIEFSFLAFARAIERAHGIGGGDDD